MNKFLSILDQLPWSVLIIGSLTLGLAPFTPPHLFEKMGMLWQGTLVRPVDIFDLLMHATLPLLLAAKSLRTYFMRPIP